MSNADSIEPSPARSTRSSARNPRRRQRQSDGDTLKGTAPRRKRSKLTESTFAPREPEAVPDSVVVVMNGDMNGSRDSRGSKRDSTPARSDVDLPVRGKRGSLKRTIKADAGKLLAQNKTYSVKLLPSTPRDLVKDGLAYRGSLGAGHHALAVSREKAYIWDYTAHTPVSNAREFRIPFTTKAAEPLPFGALIQNGASPELGLVLISAINGKVVFYESIDRAASIGLFQDRQTGVEGTLSLYSGETVIDLISAEHAGYVVALSSGRILHLSLRDTQGRPKVSTQALRTEIETTGFFGSIKGFLGSMAHKDVAAVHTRALDNRGHMQVVSLTARSSLDIWDLDWTGRYEYITSIDFRETIVSELKEMIVPERHGHAEHVVAVDFAIVEQLKPSRGSEVSILGAEQPLSIWILFKLGDPTSQEYTLAEVSFPTHEEFVIKRFQQIDPYHGTSQEKPRLVLPKPGHTGYVVFEDAVVLFATADVSLSGPEAQLHASMQDISPFEDAVYLRSDKQLAILGAVTEEARSGQASTIAFVKSAGLVRFSAVDPAGDIERTRISAKERIEQAVFFGQNPENILDFSRKGDTHFAHAEIENAVLIISSEILRSESSAISKSPTSIDDHLTTRARYLRALVTYAVQNYPGLSKRTLWQLLCDAERIAAGKELWKVFEEHKAASSKVKRTATVVDQICAFAQEQYSWTTGDSFGDELVNKIFTFNLDRLGDLLPFIRLTLEELQAAQKEEATPKVARIVKESDELWITAFSTVFAFREENADIYGIPPEFVADGLLSDATMWPELPEFWTSTESMLKGIVKSTEISRSLALDISNVDDAPAEVEERIRQIVSSNPRMIELFSLVYRERIHWLESRESAKAQDSARKLQQQFDGERHDQIVFLMDIGQSDEAMRLAEKYRDMETLTELVVAESQYCLETQQISQDAEEQKMIAKRLDDMLKRTERYFAKFGDDWANAFFDEAFSSGRAGTMLEEAQRHWADAVTTYLRSHRSRAKIGWINEVTAKHDLERAGTALVDAAVHQETKLWAKKVELSLSKLAMLAAKEDDPLPEEGMNALLSLPRRHLIMVSVQEQLYAHLYPTMLAAIDGQARLELVMKKFGERSKVTTSLHQLLERLLERVIDHEALSVGELVDVLTLVDTVPAPKQDHDGPMVSSFEFYLAMTVLDIAAPEMNPAKFEMLLKLIWKRCYMADDWVSINGKQGTKNMTGMTEEKIKKLLSETAAWRTINALEMGPLSSITILKPSECLGAACREGDLADRFPEEILVAIMRDNQIQDEELQGRVADRRLDEWIELCINHLMKATEEEEELVHVNGHVEEIKNEEDVADDIEMVAA